MAKPQKVVEPSADTSLPWQIIITRDRDGNRAFYSGHHGKTDAETLCARMNERAHDPTQAASVPPGFTYTTEKR